MKLLDIVERFRSFIRASSELWVHSCVDRYFNVHQSTNEGTHSSDDALVKEGKHSVTTVMCAYQQMKVLIVLMML